MTDNATAPRETLLVPDRFEGLRSQANSGQLQSIVVPVTAALKVVDHRFTDMRGAGRGSLMLLRGDSGAGKSTFLDTVGFFRKEVATVRIGSDADVGDALDGTGKTATPRILVLEGREALGEESTERLEAALHAVNAFVRSDRGQATLLVWPTNTDDLTNRLVALGQQLGSEALFGIGDAVVPFSGPPQAEFVDIAERTVGALNEGASLAALGISEDQAKELAGESSTVGRYLAQIRTILSQNNARVQALIPTEQYRLWTVVLAGNDPEGDVSALTRGGYAYADIDRLLTATEANIVKELKEFPEQLGLLGTVLDAKILYVDRLTALSVARQYGDKALHDLMQEAGMSTSEDSKAEGRLRSSELGLIMAGESLGTRKRGSKPGGGTAAAFTSLAKIAQTNDAALNRALGRALEGAGVIDAFEWEKDLGTDLALLSDLYCVRGGEPIRLEVMWRSSASRAQIANYVLGKLGNYGRAIGLLS